MSDRTEAIRGALADEWQTTSEIAEVAGFIACTKIRAQEVWAVLSSDEKYRLVEARRVGKKVYWRKRIDSAQSMEMDWRLEP